MKKKQDIKAFKANIDYNFLIIIGILSIVGTVLLYSASYYYATLENGDSNYYLKKHLLFLALGLIVMFIVAYAVYNNKIYKQKKFVVAAWCASIGLMILAKMGLGNTANGATRWIGIGGFTFQPSEIAKFSVILLVGYLLSTEKINHKYLKDMTPDEKKRCVLPWLVAIITAFVSFVFNNHLSAGIIIFFVVAIMIYYSRRRSPFAIMAFAGTPIALSFGYLILKILGNSNSESFRIRRFLTWIDPDKYSISGGYQVNQALYAIQSGGIFGKGLGNSIQKLGAIPEPQNDMILAIVCEEVGVVGVAFVCALFLWLFYRILFITKNSNSMYDSIICTGVLAHIGIQLVLNFAVVTNTIPNTGVTLPFISYGGSALVIIFAEIGIVLGVACKVKRRLKTQI